MDSVAPEQVSHEQIKRFLEEAPGVDLARFDFHDRAAGRKLAQFRAEAGEGRPGKGARRTRRKSAAPVSAAAPGDIDPEMLKTLLAFQRSYRLTRDAGRAEAMMALGLDSAAKIASMSPARFIEATAGVFGGDQQAALEVYARAGHVKTAALQLFGNVKDLTASPYYANAPFNTASNDLVDYFTNFPSYTALFGNMNYFKTDPGQTIFSPSAYFFDAMRIVDEYITYPNTDPVRTIPPGYTLEERRPDLFTLKLTPDNSFTEIPTLTLVNEALAASIHARDGEDAYQYLATAPFPFDLPFIRPLLALRQALQLMQTPLLALYRAMTVPGGDAARVQPLDAAREALNLSVSDLARLTTSDPSVVSVTRLYGYDIPRVPPPVDGIGTVGTLAGSSEVAGSGTRFTAEFAAGDTIEIGGTRRQVAAIASDTALTAKAPWTKQTALAYVVAPNPAPPKPPFAGQGTIAINPDDGKVEGTGTAFLTQIAVGDSIKAANQVRQVVAIASDTALTVASPFPYISVGLDYTVTPQPPQPVAPFVGTGGVVFRAGGTTATGIGTRFLTDYPNGGTIAVGQTTLVVASVASDTLLTVASEWPTDGGASYIVQPASRTGTVLDVLPAAGTGKISWRKQSTSITGTGTDFVRELRVSDQIRVGTETRTIVAILSATEATIELAPAGDSVDQPFTILKMDGLDLVVMFLERTGLTAEQLTALLTRLERHHHLARDRYGIEIVVGHRGMPALAADDGVERIGRGEQGSGAPRDRSGRHRGPDVEGEGGVRSAAPGDVFEKAVLEHEAGAVMAFLSRLEHEGDGSGELGPPRRQGPGRADQHRGVGVVAAGMHHPRVARGEGEPRLFGHRERVHVAPQKDRAAIVAAAAQDCDDSAGRGTLAKLERKALQGVPYLLRRPAAFEAELGIGMDGPAQPDRGRKLVGAGFGPVGSFSPVHGNSPFAEPSAVRP
jgi:hypothetical protein